MWQVIENGVGLGQKLRLNRDIERRINALLDLNPIQRDMLRLLIQQRNDLVHSGLYQQHGDRIFFLLKSITDSVVRRLIMLADTFETIMEMRDFIKYQSLSDKELTRKKHVIEKIEVYRKNESK
jgi:hypothetical protein